MWAAQIVFISWILQLSVAQSPTDPVVRISSGLIRGVITPTGLQFLGVPYAEAPVGDFRWKPPSPISQWGGILNTTKMAPMCPQKNLLGNGRRQALPMNEDCLYLNIYLPFNSTNSIPTSKLPVMLWIHGGGWAIGSPNYYPGDLLAQSQNVIVVAIAYRLNIFGFLLVPELLDSPINFGMLDQQLAMKWVKKNSVNFGGDPTRITLFGESAGGGSIGLHLIMKDSWPLYNNVIMESPGVWRFQTKSEKLGKDLAYAASLGCSDANGKVLDCLQKLDAMTLVPQSYLNYTMQFMPVVDGVQFSSQPLEAFLTGNYNTRPQIMIGTNEVEGNFFVYSFWLIPPTQQLSDEYYYQQFNDVWGPFLGPVAASWYEPDKKRDGNWRALATAVGDYYIVCGSHFAAQALSWSSTVYRYYFTHTPVQWMFNFLNATHFAEVPFVFNNPAAAFMPAFTAEEQKLATGMSSLWGSFAATGTPQFNSSKWQAYASPSFQLLHLDIPPFTTTQYNYPLCDNWQPFLTS